MDRKKAELILQLDKHEDVHEAYESLLFQVKTSMLNQGIIPKVLRKRQERLSTLHDAYSFLEKTESIVFEPLELSVEGDDWETLFLSYEKNKSKFKREIALGTDAIALVHAIDGLILNQKLWSEYFSFDYNKITLPILGKEMDSMELLGLFRSHKNTELMSLPDKILEELGRILKNLEAEKA